jgi:hypothetical protein
LDIHVYWNILTMHGPINVKSPNNTSKWQMGFNSAFKRLMSALDGGQWLPSRPDRFTPECPLNMRLGVTRSWYGHLEKRPLLPGLGIEPRFFV